MDRWVRRAHSSKAGKLIRNFAIKKAVVELLVRCDCAYRRRGECRDYGCGRSTASEVMAVGFDVPADTPGASRSTVGKPTPPNAISAGSRFRNVEQSSGHHWRATRAGETAQSVAALQPSQK
jgi:hypothetical protein